MDDDHRIIYLTRRYEAMVSPVDYERVRHIKWRYGGDDSPYAKAHARVNGRDKTIYLHRVIMSAPEGLVVNHRNGKTLDCRRPNLHVVRSRSNATTLKVKRGAGGYSGVYFRDKWLGESPVRKNVRAYIWVGADRRYLGQFHTLAEAALAYDMASVDLFGVYADTNFPLTNYLTPWTIDDIPCRQLMDGEIPF